MRTALFIAAVLSAANVVSAENPLSISVDPERVAVLAGDKPVLAYSYANVPFKPYIKEWHTPSGINILLDAPHDHVHHHAIMYAIEVDGVDFWGEVNAKVPGREVHRGLVAIEVDTRVGVNRAAFSEKLDWTDQTGKKVLLQERRTVEVYKAADLSASLITWESDLSLPAGKDSAEISGRQYFGLGMRFIESMDKTGHFVNADGGTGLEGTNDIRSKWCAYTAQADGKPVTVAVFDHPDNPRRPTCWFTMLDPFAYIAATLNLHHEAMTLKAPNKLRVRYGLAVWDGQIKPDEIEKLYARWTKLTKSS